MPAITSFRFLEVPTALSGQRGAIIALAERPSNLVVGAQLYFDTDPAGTFSSLLGTVRNFAAKGALASDAAAGDTTLHLSVDTTQVDADYFTQQYSVNQAANDTMLAFLVAVDGTQVAESAGFQVMEICSVSAQTLVSAGHYDLTVLRGRKNTIPAAFTTAATEVWLIPAGLLSFFNHNLFNQIRANRVAGTTPNEAQFRFCPYFFNAQLPLSSATSEAFRFPLKSVSAPALTLTAPGAFSLTYTVGVGGFAAYPLVIPIAGTWSDPDGNLVEMKVLLTPTGSADRPIFDYTFNPTGSKDFSSSVSIEKAGTYTIKFIARDSTNLVTEQDVMVTVAGDGAKCSVPQVFDCLGQEITGLQSGDGIKLDFYGAAALLSPSRYVPYGPITLVCGTPGAVIHFRMIDGVTLDAGAITQTGGDQVYSGTVQPLFMPVSQYNLINESGTHGTISVDRPIIQQEVKFEVWATAAGYADSDKYLVYLPVFWEMGTP